jgi:tRNA A-37 threonylcarbamoyl transferase component Bud32
VSERRRLPHGYTNETWADDASVWKRYVGRDSDARMRRELDAIEMVRQVVPVPDVLSTDFDEHVVRFARVHGAPGQALLERGHGHEVMEATGRTLAMFQRASDPHLVHGDYGPQNLLLDPAGHEVLLVVDWEFSEVNGNLIRDLAWAEWIVRMHHPTEAQGIDALFAGYGSTPAWPERLAEMLDKCTTLAARAQLIGEPHSQWLWEQRAATTAAWLEIP